MYIELAPIKFSPNFLGACQRASGNLVDLANIRNYYIERKTKAFGIMSNAFFVLAYEEKLYEYQTVALCNYSSRT